MSDVPETPGVRPAAAAGDGPAGSLYDVVIVGGGPAGLSATLVLGRSRRRVLVLDSGRPRNAASRAMHGYLTRDGLPPRELLRLGREEVTRYGVEYRDAEVVAARVLCTGDAPGPPAAFEVRTADGRVEHGRKLLLATGVRDFLPDLPGAETYYGRGPTTAAASTTARTATAGNTGTRPSSPTAMAARRSAWPCRCAPGRAA
jgi:thioredoxin reductase